MRRETGSKPHMAEPKQCPWCSRPVTGHECGMGSASPIYWCESAPYGWTGALPETAARDQPMTYVCARPITHLDIVMPSKDQARIRFQELVDATQGIEGVRIFGGYRRIVIGGLNMNVIAR